MQRAVVEDVQVGTEGEVVVAARPDWRAWPLRCLSAALSGV